MKVSVVTPSYNQGQFIERTLLSVANQKKNGFEVEHVVFDGGSTDNTIEVLKKFGQSIRWESKSDKGQTDAVNQGIRATNGEIVGWLNSDDIYYTDTIQCIVDFFKSNPNVDVVYGMADHIDLEDRPFESYPSEPWDFERLKDVCYICQPALFFRRDVVLKHGYLDEALNYCMDYEYWLRLGKAGVEFRYIERKLAGSRLYADNKTLGSRVKVHKEINDMFKRLFMKVPDRWLYNYAHAVVYSKSDNRLQKKRDTLKIGIYSLISAICWNRSVTLDMRRIILKWLICR